MSDLRLIWCNLWRNPIRTGLLLVAVFVAFLLYGVLATVGRGFESGVDLAAANRLVVANRVNFTQPLPIAYVNRVRAVDGVRQVTYLEWFGGYFREPRNFLIAFAVDPESYLDAYPEYRLPPEERRTFIGTRTALLVGAEVAERFGWKVGDRVPLYSNVWTHADGGQSWDFTIAGIIRGETAQTDTDVVLLHHKYLDETRTYGKDTIGTITLITDGPAVNDRVVRTVDALFANSAYETETTTEAAFQKAFLAQLGDIGMIVTAVVAAAFAAILLIVGNTLVMAIRERTREIAVLKTIGFSAGRIFRLVLGEATLLALLGGGAGLSAAAGAVIGLNTVLARILPPLVLTPDILATAFGLMVALGMLTGLVPAVHAWRLNIVAGLGRE